MGTKAIIATPMDDEFSHLYKEVEDKYFKSILLSYDGYPDNVYNQLRQILKQYDVKVIMAGGNIQSLQPKYEPNPLGYHSVDLPQSDVTVVYKRDLDNKDDVKLSNFNYKVIQIKDRKEWYPYSDYLYVVHKDQIYCLNEEKLEFEVLDGK